MTDLRATNGCHVAAKHRSTCKLSPFCLNGLSQFTLADASNSPSGLPDQNGVGTNVPRNGLKNYGSTCYLNAFLQLYVRFGKLRQAIFSLPEEQDETGIIHHLQLIFSQLELGTCGVVDPGGLIEALRLCEEEQQDAPEFHNLFMHLLESRFLEAGISVVDDLIRGEYVYETRCLHCGLISRQPSNFLELSLKVSSNSLPGCIRDYLKEESLTGENQYACPRCMRKQNGVRRAYITRAPSLLCIQLLRFTYDPRTGQRKKQKASVRLPDSMTLVELSSGTTCVDPNATTCSVACLGPQSGSVHRRSYQLCGVLLHIGTQPTSGHYVAVVRETSRPHHSTDTSDARDAKGDDLWTICNDTEVCSIPASQFNLAKVTGSSKPLHASIASTTPVDFSNSDIVIRESSQPLDPLAKKHRPNPNASGADDAHQPDSTEQSISESASATSSSGSLYWHRSSNAYMIFYHDIENSPVKDAVHVPDRLRQMVEQVNKSRDQELHEQQAMKVNKLSCLRSLLTSLWPPVPQYNDTSERSLEPFSLVPTSWLADWLDQPEGGAPCLSNFKDSFAPLPRAHAQQQQTSIVDPFSKTPYSTFSICPHGRVPIDLPVSLYRAVSTTGLLNATGLAEHLHCDQQNPDSSTPDSSCVPARFQPCRECVCLKVALLRLEQSIRSLSKDLDRFTRSKPAPTPVAHRDEAGHESKNGCQPETHVLPNDPKAHLDPAFYWIGKRSLRQWRILSRAYVNNLYSGSSGNPCSPRTTFNSDTLCPHAKLRSGSRHLRHLPAPLWCRLVDLFPGANIPTFPVSATDSQESKCEACEQYEEGLVRRAACERVQLSGLLLPTSRRIFPYISNTTFGSDGQMHTNSIPSLFPMSRKRTLDCTSASDSAGTLTVGPNCLSPSGESDNSNRDVYLVPSKFIHSWRRFIRNPSPETHPRHLPSGLNGSGVLCEHDRLTMPWQELLSESILFPLSFSEWDILSNSYPRTTGDEATSRSSNESDSDSSDSDLWSHSKPPHPPTYLSFNGTEWQFHPAQFESICSICYTQLLNHRNSYKNARIRVRLMNGSNAAGMLEADTSEASSVDTECISPNRKHPSLQANQNSNGTFEQGQSENSVHQTNASFTTGGTLVTEADSTTSAVRLKTKQQAELFGVRRSTRQRLLQNDLTVQASSDQSLQQLKVQLMQSTGVTPADQHIWFNGVEITETNKTLQELGIHANSLLHLWTDSPVWGANELNPEMDYVHAGTTKGSLSTTLSSPKSSLSGQPAGCIELGFKGTRLLNN
ncbi:unnamed protein product [Dicrocoelium dendriticum]|nr:unnamed protein product [Dicrocoelium dendriticum]